MFLWLEEEEEESLFDKFSKRLIYFSIYIEILYLMDLIV